MSSKLSEKDLLGEGAATAEVEDQLASKTTGSFSVFAFRSIPLFQCL
jgi:hypothetical protein